MRLMLFSSVVVGAPPAVGGERERPPVPWRVVLLLGADSALPAMQQFDRAMREVIQREAPGGVTFFTDTIDAIRFDYTGIAPEFLALQRKKYTGQPADLIVGVGPNLGGAVRDQRESLWPGTPVLISAIDAATFDRSSTPQGAVHQFWQYDIDGTLDLIEALQPRARRLVLVGGSGEFDLEITARVLERARQRSRFDTEVWAVLEIEELRNRLSTLGTDTAVFFTMMTRDANGRTGFPRDALSQLAEVSGAPIYGLFGSFFDFGATAGSVLDFEAMGRITGELGVALLSGRAREVRDTVVPSRCVADLARLERFGLSVQALPVGCELRNAPRSLWTDYRGFVLASGAVVALQALTIGGLLLQRQGRLQAELDAGVHRTELARAMRFAAMGELTASIAHEINQPLGAILSNADAAVLLLRGGAATPEALSEILADIRRDDLRATEVIRRLRALLEKHEVEHAPMALHPALRDTVALLEPEARLRGVSVELALDAANDTMIGDPIQLQQVVLNLAMNAMDAMESTPASDRRLAISTSADGDAIEMTVADRGPGIPASRRDSVFQSFYTTKTHGMGLGLPIVRAIVGAHDGTILIEERSGGGALVRVRLPRAARRSPSTSPFAEAASQETD